MGYYLMVKEAIGLNVKYLCKCGDYKDPIKYRGSGVYWRRIINKHNCNIETTILGFYETAAELRSAGEYYSDLFDVVHDKTWANLIPEIGDGGPTTKGKVRAYNPDTGQDKCFESEQHIPKGWTRGLKTRPVRSRSGIEKTRAFHTGRKRSEETRNRMKNAKRRKRLTVECQYCHRQITKQNLKRHFSLTHGM